MIGRLYTPTTLAGTNSCATSNVHGYAKIIQVFFNKDRGHKKIVRLGLPFIKNKQFLPLIVHAIFQPRSLALLSLLLLHLQHLIFSHASYHEASQSLLLVLIHILTLVIPTVSGTPPQQILQRTTRRTHHLLDSICTISRGTMSAYTTVPAAPPAAPPASSFKEDGWSPLAIIGIVASIMVILLCVPLIAICLRRYERKRCKEMVKDSGNGGSSRGSDDLSRLQEGQSLKSILVTKELQRTSLKLSKPEEAYLNGRGWSKAEVRGNGWHV